ncbi:MAG TPA: glycosyltransferase family 4 protein [Sideroxyarcus sp.]|nr:glycosyltransferase family 4 protein [Sideroxyarcus sp.]
MRKLQVCLVGIFPPPLHGMSLITEYVKKRLSENASPLVIDFAPHSLERSFIVRFGKVFRVFQCLFQLLSYLITGRVGAVYLGLSGGYGQIYDAMFACLCRVFGRKLYLHHHGYQYLNQYRRLSKLLFTLAGKDAVHIVACEKMGCDLKRLYPIVSKVNVISGIAALDVWDVEVVPRERLKSIGFLSNISIEKGILEFLDIAAWADQAGLPLRFVLAGPYHDEKIRRFVEKRLSTLPNVTHVGAVYGEAKLAFFDSLDVFMLPSHNESEGLVIHEAMSRGVPVIAYSRGCIEQIVSEAVGLRLAPAEDFVASAICKINGWMQCPDEFVSASRAALRQFSESRILHTKKMDDLCAELIAESSD